MTHLTKPLRWTARIWSVASLLFLLLVVVGQAGSSDKQVEIKEWVGLALFPGGICIGLMTAFRNERLGGIVTLSSLAGFYVWHSIVAGDLPGGPFFVLLAAPGILWLVCGFFAQSDGSCPPRMVSHDGAVPLKQVVPEADKLLPAGSAAADPEIKAAGLSRPVAIIVTSMHHDNTLKVARAMAAELNATLLTPEQAFAEDLTKYQLVGFGSGIYFGQHHRALRKLVRNLTRVPSNVFIFSTAGLPWLSRLFHWPLRKALLRRGCRIAAEFNCRGWDTVGPLLFVGGINRQHPNARDMDRAVSFARQLANAE